MGDSKGNLTNKQQKAVFALLTEPTVKQAAEQSGISETTMYRYLQLDDFQASYKEAKRETVKQATARLQQASTTAIDTLMDVMTNKKAVAMARVTAAKTVLEFAYKAYEMDELQERMDRIEEALDDKSA